jgi:hypothetical protein
VEKHLVGLQLSAEDHAVDIGSAGVLSYDGTDGSHSFDRMSRYGKWSGLSGECLWFGKLAGAGAVAARAEAIVDDLIIADGSASRAHRTCIFEPRYSVCGVAVAPHVKLGQVVVIVSDHRHVHAGSVLSQSPGQARGHALMPGGGGVMDVCLLVVGVDVGLSWCVCVCVFCFLIRWRCLRRAQDFAAFFDDAAPAIASRLTAGPPEKQNEEEPPAPASLGKCKACGTVRQGPDFRSRPWLG